MKSALAFLRSQILPAVLCFGLAWLLTAWDRIGRSETLRVLTGRDLFDRIENLTLDQRTKLRAWLKPQAPADDVVLLGIDETSLKDFGEWPWNREIHGDLLSLLGLVKPGVIAWDILFIGAA